MRSSAQYLSYAELAFAAYADALVTNPKISNASRYEYAGFLEKEAQHFNEKLLVLSQSPANSNGFSAALMRNRKTDVDLEILKNARNQLVDMVNWWFKITTQRGKVRVRYSLCRNTTTRPLLCCWVPFTLLRQMFQAKA